MPTIRLPELHANWPFPRTINSHCETTGPASLAWLESFRLFSTRDMLKFRGSKAGHLASLCYPHHSEEHLRSATDLMNILIAVDDITDKLEPKAAREVADAIMDALRCVTSHTQSDLILTRCRFPNKPRPAGEDRLGEVHRR